MDYLCLAAGQGTRFGTLGSYLQKCMYPLGLRPFLEFSMQNLSQSRHLDLGRDRLILVVGHHGEQVKSYFGSSYGGLSIHYLEQTEARGTGHALHLAYQAFQPTQAVICWLADLYVSTPLFEALHDHPETNVLTVAPDEYESNDNIRVTLEHDLITRAWQGSSDLFEIGLWKLGPELLAQMTAVQTGDEYRALPNVQRAIENGVRVGYLKTDEWLHLGGVTPTPEANVRAVSQRVLELVASHDYR